jgi:hypothetical protein
MIPQAQANPLPLIPQAQAHQHRLAQVNSWQAAVALNVKKRRTTQNQNLRPNI